MTTRARDATTTWSPFGLWSGIEAELPTATLRIFRESGHPPFLEEPERFAEALTGFMSRPISVSVASMVETTASLT